MATPDLDRGDRRLPDLPPRRARPRARDDPRLPRRTCTTTRRARRRRATGPRRRTRRSATSRRGRGAAGRGTQASRRRASGAGGRAQGLLPVRLRRGPDRRGRRRHLDLPQPSRLLPETLTVDETERLLEAAGGDDPDAPGYDRRAPRPRAPRAALRRRPADQRGARP